MTTLTSPLSDFVIFAGDAVTTSGPIDLTREGNRGRYYGNSSVFQDPLNFVGNNCENVSYDEPVNTAAQTLRSNLFNAIGFMTSEEGFPVRDTILPGIYIESGSISISNRNLVFDAQDDPNALFYVISGQAIIFEGVSSISLQNGAQYQNIYWRAGTDITFEAGFEDKIQGIFLAGSSIITGSNNDIYGNLYSNTGTININNERSIQHNNSVYKY
jgi:hypothetical protein